MHSIGFGTAYNTKELLAFEPVFDKQRVRLIKKEKENMPSKTTSVLTGSTRPTVKHNQCFTSHRHTGGFLPNEVCERVDELSLRSGTPET